MFNMIYHRIVSLPLKAQGETELIILFVVIIITIISCNGNKLSLPDTSGLQRYADQTANKI